ncbi:hypothetical protein NO559_01450 [Dasania sp. GY-MA-18]|uniref:Lipoprotein n=1 Tax=Dasania phycosphaerae TaxID=2950436 RepID=A0A9J6RHB1_9GAMM|nr:MULTISPECIES: hypothetical protein [Dasania]MCR8921416.1 hypothetical protein [Dasania sp. GY-MA-18]MCZ0863844.1 hypothetical protein [Dasania phycosphaerae]MCZ0867572.1 hypothetical protein [Dasania phycosphaerae]
MLPPFLRCHIRTLLISTGLTIIGCASAPPMDAALKLTRNGQFEQAELALNSAIAEQGKNRLLHRLELGMINHLKGDYQRSTYYFDEAEQLIDNNYTISLSNEVAKLLTGPSLTPYQSQQFENSFVHYYKALNYLKLAQNSDHIDNDYLDSALVEIRKLSHRLEQQRFQTGGYPARPAPGNDEERTATQLLDLFKQALGEPAHSDKLVYRDDAYGHYIAGLLFELAGNADNARISYQRAAQSYQNGFAQQYRLGDRPAQQAWYDVARVMKLDNDPGWQDIAQRHLSSQQRQQLQNLDAQTSDLVIIQHSGTMPRREELNLRLTLDSYSRSLVLWPMPTGSREQQRAQLAWFLMLYSDTSLFDILQNYAVGDVGTVVQGAISKRIPIGMLWRNVEKLNLVKALEFGARVAVPYYPPLQNSVNHSELFINGSKASQLLPAESIMRIALQEQIRRSNTDIQLALTRELTKAIAAQHTADESGAAALGGLLKIVNLLTASADTRNWLTLPNSIQLSRLNLAPGQHQIELKTTLNNGFVVRQKQTLNVVAGRPTLWHTHTYQPVGIASKPL